MAAFSQKEREEGKDWKKTSSEGTPIWLRSPKRKRKKVKIGLSMTKPYDSEKQKLDGNWEAWEAYFKETRSGWKM